MSKVTINGHDVNPNSDLSKLIAALTRTKTLGTTIIDAASLLDVQIVDGEAYCENVDKLAGMAPSDAPVIIVAENKNESNRSTTWEGIVKIAKAAVQATPHARAIDSLGDSLKGVVTWESGTKESSSGNGGIDYNQSFAA